MKTFQEWLLVEMKVKCNRCSAEQGVSQFTYNSGKARCSACGGSVEPVAEKKVTDASKAAAARADAKRPSSYNHRANS